MSSDQTEDTRVSQDESSSEQDHVKERVKELRFRVKCVVETIKESTVKLKKIGESLRYMECAEDKLNERYEIN